MKNTLLRSFVSAYINSKTTFFTKKGQLILVLFISIWFVSSNLNAQCLVDAGPNKTITCGSNVQLEGQALSEKVIFSEDFSGYSRGNLTTNSGAWRVTSGTWRYGGDSDRMLTTSDGTGNSNEQKYSNNSNSIAYYDTPINATGYYDLFMVFDWKALGEKSSGIAVDYGKFVYSLDNKATWIEMPDIYYNQSTTQAGFEVDLSDLDGKTFYIGFQWISNNSTINNPGFVIDNIILKGKKGTVSWFPATGLSSSTILNPIATPTVTTKYYLTLTDGACSSLDSVTVTVTDANIVEAGTVPAICEGNTTTLNGSYTVENIHVLLLNSNFNNGTDDFIKTNEGDPNGNTWGRAKSFTNGNETISSGGSYFFRLQSDKTGDGSSNVTTSYLRSPAFSTVGYTNLALSFRHYFRQSAPNNNSTISVEYSTDNSTWTELANLTGSTTNNHRVGSATNFHQENFSLPASLENIATVYIRFKYVHSVDWSWSIDDVSVGGVSTTTTNSTFSWSPAVQSGGTTLTPTVQPTGTTMYYLNVQRGACLAKDSVAVVVDVKPVVPTTITVDNNVNNCWGRAITLTANGGTTPGNSKYIWGTSVGGNELGTTNKVNEKSFIPTQSDSYYVSVDANGACPKQNLTTPVTVNLPNKGNALSGNNESATCYMSGTNPIHFYSTVAPYNYIGSINPEGRTGTLTMTSYLNSFGTTKGVDDGTMYACDKPVNELYRTAYMMRSFVVKDENIPASFSNGSNVKVYFPFTDTELNDLVVRSKSGNTAPGNTGSNPFDNVEDRTFVNATKYNGSNENGIATDNCVGGTSSILQQKASGQLSSSLELGLTPTIDNNVGTGGTKHFVKYEVPSFSEFILHGALNNSPLPIELISFSGSCTDFVTLNWTTATELNTSHYIVEKTINGTDWILVQSIDAVGNSSVQQTYSIKDEDRRGSDQPIYYRLSSVDNDGSVHVYNAISVICKGDAIDWSVYPSPSSDFVTISIVSDELMNNEICFYDMNGKIIKHVDAMIVDGMNAIYVDVKDLANGVYFIQMKDTNKGFKSLRFVKND